MKNIVIIGASGHGSVILDCIEKEGKYNVFGFVDSFKEKGEIKNGYQILGSEYDLPSLMEMFDIYGGIVAIGDNWTRKRVVDRISVIAPSFKFISSIHPNASIGKEVYIGRGTIIMPGAVVNANSIVKDFCIVNTNASLGHDGVMEDYSSLACGVCCGGGLSLGAFSAVSAGAVIRENISVESHTVIGAGALILKDLPDCVVAFGSPAYIVKTRAIGDCYLSGGKRNIQVLPIVASA
ncbi:hypothetical protein LCGC14_1283260 [marine sediment metagenome]|uniref:Acetyltransferase n=2 Tax=root TaxID=1 RepID=A0A831QQB5_9FLAO|nr:acetyltransferase [Pricia sp.]HEA22423.1 acetyltransferase [Pricia antarctica]